MFRNTADTNRHKGGPGSSQQNADKPETHHTEEHKPTPGESTNADRSRVSGGGGEGDRHHTHNPATKS
jgi:hypothetical protein